MEVERYDFCVIGAGAGGLVVTSVVAQLGLKVALIEKDKMGGDCLNYGCVPSKALLAAAKHAAMCRHLESFGIANVEPQVDYAKVAAYVRSVIQQIEPHDSVERFEKLGATVIKGAAEFISNKQVKVNNRLIEAKYFVIATGSHPAIPPIKGLDTVDYLTNETIFNLTTKPEHLLVIGAGPIGIELAQAHLMLGTKVTVLDLATMLPRDDQEAVAVLREQLIQQGLTLHEKIKISHVDMQDQQIVIHYENQHGMQTLTGSHLLIAAGRVANIEGLSLDKAGVKYERAIEVDQRLRTSNKSIYALGDVTGGYQFTHIANYQAGIVIRNTLFKLPSKVDYSTLPWVTYTSPEVAQLGLNETMAQQQGVNYNLTKMPFNELDRYRAEGESTGFIKILTDKKDRILGVTVVGEAAGELLLTWSLAMKNDLRLGKITELIAPYPTRSEMTKRVAGKYFEPILFSEKTRKIARFLIKI